MWPWVPPVGPAIAGASLVYHKKIGQKVVHSNINHITVEGPLMIYLFYLIHQNI